MQIVWLSEQTFFFKKKILFIFRGEGREKESEKNISVWLPLMRPLLGTLPATQACVLTGNQTSDPLLHRLGTQSTEQHQPEQKKISFMFYNNMPCNEFSDLIAMYYIIILSACRKKE